MNEINRVKKDLKTTGKFTPNLSLFNQNKTFLFGSIKLNKYWLNLNSFKSQILTDEQSSELIKLCEFSPTDKWSLLYRGTRDGFQPDDFHMKCDGHSNTLSIFKAKKSSFIFGGFTTVDWDSSSGEKSDPIAFIFSLTNKDNQPLKMKIDPEHHDFAICCDPEYGPIFGNGHDILITKSFSNNTANLGNSYKHPQYENGTDEADNFLAGSFYFKLEEIEVYQKEIHI